MKMLLLIFSFFAFAGCAVNKKAQEGVVRAISFGSGGGFTGIENRYMLTREGQLYKLIDKDTIALKKIDAKEALTFFSEAEKLYTYEYSNPGNVTFFLELSATNKANRIAWDAATEKINPAAVTLYKKLIALP